MKTEEILKRAEEYRFLREALGVYWVELARPDLGDPSGAPRASRPAPDGPMAGPRPGRAGQPEAGASSLDPGRPRPGPG